MPLRFRKVLIADERYEAATVFDVNNNGTLDIVSGAWWYEGPDFTEKHKIANIPVKGEYFDAFCAIPLDVNGNGRTDYVIGGYFSESLIWYENPEDPSGEWPEHVLADCGHVETARGWDIDGDGTVEIIPNTPGGVLAYKLVKDADGKGTGEFSEHLLYDCEAQGHGMGCGDIAGNGRMDIVLWNCWLEAPQDPLTGEWTRHEHPGFGEEPSIPVLVVDVTGNGLGDFIVGQAHDYGLDWYEQKKDSDGNRSWIKHPIDPGNSQFHDLHWIDIDGDGQCELVTGKRYRGHCGSNPGAADDYGLYYYKWTGENFSKQVIDYGPLRVGTGVGIQFATADFTGNGLPDIVAPGKDGLYVFYNEGM